MKTTIINYATIALFAFSLFAVSSCKKSDPYSKYYGTYIGVLGINNSTNLDTLVISKGNASNTVFIYDKVNSTTITAKATTTDTFGGAQILNLSIISQPITVTGINVGQTDNYSGTAVLSIGASGNISIRMSLTGLNEGTNYLFLGNTASGTGIEGGVAGFNGSYAGYLSDSAYGQVGDTVSVSGTSSSIIITDKNTLANITAVIGDPIPQVGGGIIYPLTVQNQTIKVGPTTNSFSGTGSLVTSYSYNNGINDSTILNRSINLKLFTPNSASVYDFTFSGGMY